MTPTATSPARRPTSSTTSASRRRTSTRWPRPTPASRIDEAAAQYERELQDAAPDSAVAPKFDITLLGVGPDGHTASLFPEFPQLSITDRTVVPVDDSPKPPPQRLTLTYPAINASQRVWVILSGAEKASVLGLALAGASVDEVPVGGVQGRKRTVFFVDQDAARDVPENLIASTY